jgi:hypothetical protein
MGPTVWSEAGGAQSYNSLRPHDALGAVRLRASEGDVIVLAIKADDEHGARVAIAFRLVRGQNGCQIALRGDVSDPLTETTKTEFLSAAEEVNRAVCVVRGEDRLHRAVVLIAEGKKVRPH